METKISIKKLVTPLKLLVSVIGRIRQMETICCLESVEPVEKNGKVLASFKEVGGMNDWLSFNTEKYKLSMNGENTVIQVEFARGGVFASKF